MPEEFGGRIYLTQSEAMKRLRLTTPTFHKNIDPYGLRAESFVGRTRYKYYLEDAIEAIVANPKTDEANIQQVRQKIQELQQ